MPSGLEAGVAREARVGLDLLAVALVDVGVGALVAEVAGLAVHGDLADVAVVVVLHVEGDLVERVVGVVQLPDLGDPLEVEGAGRDLDELGAVVLEQAQGRAGGVGADDAEALGDLLVHAEVRVVGGGVRELPHVHIVLEGVADHARDGDALDRAHVHGQLAVLAELGRAHGAAVLGEGEVVPEAEHRQVHLVAVEERGHVVGVDGVDLGAVVGRGHEDDQIALVVELGEVVVREDLVEHRGEVDLAEHAVVDVDDGELLEDLAAVGRLGHQHELGRDDPPVHVLVDALDVGDHLDRVGDEAVGGGDGHEAVALRADADAAHGLLGDVDAEVLRVDDLVVDVAAEDLGLHVVAVAVEQPAQRGLHRVGEALADDVHGAVEPDDADGALALGGVDVAVVGLGGGLDGGHGVLHMVLLSQELFVVVTAGGWRCSGERSLRCRPNRGPASELSRCEPSKPNFSEKKSASRVA